MRKILFPTDCSPLAHNAFMYAIEVAKLIDAEIDIISIFHLPMADASAMPPEYIDQMIDERRNEAVQQVAQFVEGYEDVINDVRVDYGVFVATEIYEAAGDGDYGLIIMGTKGKHNALERIMGSVTSQVMIHAPCPVLAVPESATYKPIKKVAYATDFHLKDEDIVLQLLEISNRLGAMVHYVHVDKNEEDLAKKVATLAGFAKVDHLSNNSVTDGLNQYIAEQEMDLLAMYIPKRGLWEKLFHTSITKRMALHTHTPLLVFREK